MGLLLLAGYLGYLVRRLLPFGQWCLGRGCLLLGEPEGDSGEVCRGPKGGAAIGVTVKVNGVVVRRVERVVVGGVKMRRVEHRVRQRVLVDLMQLVLLKVVLQVMRGRHEPGMRLEEIR